MCGCGSKIRVSKTVLAVGPILCGMYGTEFAIEPDSDADVDLLRGHKGEEKKDRTIS